VCRGAVFTSDKMERGVGGGRDEFGGSDGKILFFFTGARNTYRCHNNISYVACWKERRRDGRDDKGKGKEPQRPVPRLTHQPK